jgi:hypothetical protein
MEENSQPVIAPTPPPQTVPTEEKKKSILPMSLIIVGALSLVFPLWIIWIIVPNTLNLASTVHDTTINVFSYLPSAIILALFIGEIFYGVRLYRVQKEKGELSIDQRKIAKRFLIIGLLAAFVSLPLLMGNILAPIYSIMTDLQQDSPH